MIIELLKDCYGWESGFQTNVVDHDDECYYFYDEWHRWSYVKKENIEEYKIKE